MIPEVFKQNCSFEIIAFGAPVQVCYRFYSQEKREPEQIDPLISHIEFRAAPCPVSGTGYYSYFFQSRLLESGAYKGIEEFALAAAEFIAKENGFDPPAPASELKSILIYF
ncbi:hypothetical protein ACS5PU_16645 [Pedobacter sp. GSP4]|uniref:hypothetical protein n=1 Tax=Pedobacter sp. GSP4 TaxID=3453716 RepID=UPI003EECE5CE